MPISGAVARLPHGLRFFDERPEGTRHGLKVWGAAARIYSDPTNYSRLFWLTARVLNAL
jgi:hypothetical protein